jgi:hypothetical protein
LAGRLRGFRVLLLLLLRRMNPLSLCELLLWLL